MHRAMLMDFKMMEQYIPERDKLQANNIKTAYRVNDKERFALTCDAFKQSRELTKKWWKTFQENPAKPQGGFLYQRYWKKQNEKAELYF